MMQRLSNFGFTLSGRIRHWRRAFAYATGRLSSGQAQDIILDCQHIAGWYALMTITPDDVLDSALSQYGNQARALDPYLAAACQYVARKWEGGEEYSCAQDWVLDTTREYAAQDGIDLDEAADNSNPNHEGELADA